METILHVEPIVRRVSPPLTIGHRDYMYYGNKAPVSEDFKYEVGKNFLGESEVFPMEVEQDNLGEPAVFMPLGFPVEGVDLGSTKTHVPLIKTIECMPDPDRRSGLIYLESIHYFKDSKYLIPIRSKIHSGRSEGVRFTHLPSLNFVRQDLTGDTRLVNDVRSEIISGLVENDRHFVENHRHPINEWIKHDMLHTLETSSVTDIRFDTKRLSGILDSFVDEVSRVPYEMSQYHLKRVLNRVSIENETIPSAYFSGDVIHKTLMDVKHRMVPSQHDFRSFGRLPIENIPNLEYNPFAFQDVLAILDNSPLTDCNLDVIVQTDNTIVHIDNHVSVNRLGVFKDNDLGAFSPETLCDDFLDEYALLMIIEKFHSHHPAVKNDEELRHILNAEPVKLKIIKTINDEALILLFRYNSSGRDKPLCGVYFDIALQSLAPLTIIPETKLY